MTVHGSPKPRDLLFVVGERAAQSTLSDGELLGDVERGQEYALRTLYDRHASTLLGVAYRILGEHADAEEVVLETFTQAWRQAASYDKTRGSVIAWLSTIARSRALDLMRAATRRARTRVDAVQGVVDGPPAMGNVGREPDYAAEQNERRQRVQTALADLPDDQRKAIELAYYGGMSQSEIAHHLNEPLGTVKTRIRSGMMKLRDALRSLYGDSLA